MIETAITKMLGIQYPVFQGGMAWIAGHTQVTATATTAVAMIQKAGFL